MSALTILNDTDASTPLLRTEDHATIASELNAVGVRFERWEASRDVKAGYAEADVITAYQKEIHRLFQENGYQTVDVLGVKPDHPEKASLRKKFLSEHTHSEDEVRFFVDGQGLFSLHIGDKVYEVLCEKGDLISVPAKTTHWFDMGPNPDFVCIRLFNNPEGWVANYTGTDIADRFNRLAN